MLCSDNESLKISFKSQQVKEYQIQFRLALFNINNILTRPIELKKNLGGCAFHLVEITSLLHVIVMLEEKNIENN